VRNPKRYFGENFTGSVNISRDSHKAVPLERDRQLADLQQMLAVNNAKLAEARQAQAEMLRKQRELEEREGEVEPTVERKVQENLTAVRDKARLEAEDAFKSKVTEKKAQLAGMQPQIEELRRKAHPGLQQLQGQALEIELAFLLRSRFPRDVIEPAFPIAPPRASPASASRTSGGSATARNGGPDARDASASPNGGTGSIAATTKAAPG